MGFFKRKKPAMESKHSRFSTCLPYQTSGISLWDSGETLESNVTFGYEQNITAYRCINLLSKSVGSIPLVLYQKDKKLSQHPLLNLLEEPNPFQNYQELTESLISYLYLTGNGFLEHVGTEELYVLRPDRMRIIPDEKGFPKAYEYVLGSKRTQVHVDPLTGASPVLHLHFFNPLNEWVGLSPLKVARESILLQNATLRHNIALLENGGRPSGALIVKSPHGLTETQRFQLREDIENLYAGKNHAGRLMILEGDFSFEEMSKNEKEFDYSNGNTATAQQICQAFGIPPLCLGFLGDPTFSNYKEARLHLWEDTILPLADYLISHYNKWLVPLFEDNLRLSFDKDQISALSGKSESLWNRVEKMTCLTLNEKRALLGYHPIPEGDCLQRVVPQQTGEESEHHGFYH